MQEVAKFVEDGFNLAMGEERRLASDRRGKVAADQSEVRAKLIGGGAAGDQGIHPGAAALILAGIPVGVEAPEEHTVFVADVVIAHLRIPYRNVPFLGDVNSVQAVYETEQTLSHFFQWEVGTERLLKIGRASCRERVEMSV